MDERSTEGGAGRDRRPGSDEHDLYYGRYVGAVPDGDVVETLQSTGRELVALLASVPPEREEHRYAPDRWSVREVAGHVIDSERVFRYRAAHIARGDPAPLPDMDQEAWAEASNAGERPLPELVRELGAVRRDTVALFGGLAPETWDRRGTASEATVSVRALAWIIAGHGEHHRRILRERYGLGPGERGPSLRVPRRRDRGKEEEWIRAWLRAATVGHLAVSVEGGPPHVNSNLFVYDDARRCVHLHTARTGRLPDLLREGPRRATFAAVAAGRLLPADEALEFSLEYSGVTLTGWVRRVDDRDEQRRALQALLDKYAPHLRPGRDYRPPVPEELERTAVHRLEIESWSGKEKAAPDDFPGAFPLPDVPVPFRPGEGETGPRG